MRTLDADEKLAGSVNLTGGVLVAEIVWKLKKDIPEARGACMTSAHYLFEVSPGFRRKARRLKYAVEEGSLLHSPAIVNIKDERTQIFAEGHPDPRRIDKTLKEKKHF